MISRYPYPDLGFRTFDPNACIFSYTGRHLVAGHHCHRAGERRAPVLRSAPNESIIPHSQEQSTTADRQLQQAIQGVCRGLPQQGPREREFLGDR